MADKKAQILYFRFSSFGAAQEAMDAVWAMQDAKKEPHTQFGGSMVSSTGETDINITPGTEKSPLDELSLIAFFGEKFPGSFVLCSEPLKIDAE